MSFRLSYKLSFTLNMAPFCVARFGPESPFPLPWREGIEGRGFTPTLTSPVEGEGNNWHFRRATIYLLKTPFSCCPCHAQDGEPCNGGQWMSQLLKGLIDRASYRHYGPNNAINNSNFVDKMWCFRWLIHTGIFIKVIVVECSIFMVGRRVFFNAQSV